ncbi:MAG: hypothetical protein M3389_04215, partial [Actinomycetota bacterium]|nr:hypothetical protein [Actinomycetota bacterium]
MKLTPLAARAALAATAATLALALTPGSAAAASLPAGSTALLTGTSSLFEALPAPVGDASITTQSVSQDGKYVAFASSSDGLVDGDDDSVTNVYRKDMTTGEVILVSRRNGPDGAPSHGECSSPTISDDGMRVAFSCYDALDDADANGLADVYVRTVPSNATTLVSRNGVSGPSGDGESSEPTLSENGDYVAFSSTATQLVAGGTKRQRHVFRRHLPTQTTVLVSRGTGATGAEAHGHQPSITDDGTAVAFASGDAVDPALDKNNQQDVYVRDLAADSTVLASRRTNSAGGEPGNSYSGSPMISGNGLAVVFESYATNLDARDTTPDRNVYRRSLGLSATSVIDVTPAGAKSGAGWSPSIDDSSHVIAFVSDATGLDPADTDPSPDIYVRYLGGANEVRAVSRASGANGAVANKRAAVPAMSGDAYHVASSLGLGGITPDADPRRPAVILRGLATHATRPVSRPAGTDPFVNAGGSAEGASLTPDGRYTAFVSDAAGLGLPPSAQNGAFVRDRVTGDVTLVSVRPDGTPFLSVRGATISADGRRVAFAARETPNGVRQVWVRDLASGAMELASRATG